MSVYIKGMEMPGTGRYLIVYPDGRVVDTDIDGESQCIIPGSKAIPVPEHGRLIDADDMSEKDNKDFSVSMGTAVGFAAKQLMIMAHAQLQKAIEIQPTIIPAEEGEG